jgi:hypothetical protein
MPACPVWLTDGKTKNGKPNMNKQKGGFKKVGEWSEEQTCRDPQHNPPGMIDLDPGIYEWTCPTCGKVTPVKVAPRPTLAAKRTDNFCPMHGSNRGDGVAPGVNCNGKSVNCEHNEAETDRLIEEAERKLYNDDGSVRR